MPVVFKLHLVLLRHLEVEPDLVSRLAAEAQDDGKQKNQPCPPGELANWPAAQEPREGIHVPLRRRHQLSLLA